MLLRALEKGTDPDRMKGALYVLWNKGIGKRLIILHKNSVDFRMTASYALAGKLKT